MMLLINDYLDGYHTILKLYYIPLHTTCTRGHSTGAHCNVQTLTDCCLCRCTSSININPNHQDVKTVLP